jgi:hypothetical protein
LKDEFYNFKIEDKEIIDYIASDITPMEKKKVFDIVFYNYDKKCL